MEQDAIQTLAALVAALIEAAPRGEPALRAVAGGPLGEQLLKSFEFRNAGPNDAQTIRGVLATLRQESPITLAGCEKAFGRMLGMNITSPSNVPSHAWLDLPVGYKFSVDGHELFLSCRHGDIGKQMNTMALWFHNSPRPTG